jgi:hypothetical protein
MRALILAAGASLALAGCGDGETQQVAANGDQTETSASIATNDTTAIDAATGDAANMAADVDFTVNEGDNAAENGASNAAGNTGGNRAEEQ